MEVFISNLQSKTTTEQLREPLGPVLSRSGIDIYDIHKTVGKTHGFLTIPDYAKALRFLTTLQNVSALSSLSTPGRQVSFRQSKKPPDTRLLRVLQKEQKDQKARSATRKIGKPKRAYDGDNTNLKDGLLISTIECGRWETNGSGKEFMPYFALSYEGRVIQQPRALKIKLDCNPKFEVTMDIDSIRSVAISKGLNDKCTAVIALALAPKIHEHRDLDQDDTPLGRMVTHFRDTKIPGCGQTTTGSCLVYRLTAKRTYTNLGHFKKHLQDLTSYRMHIVQESAPPKWFNSLNFNDGVTLLDATLKQLKWPFALKYQVQKLWANAHMSPKEVQVLISDMVTLRARAGDEVLVSVLRRVCLQLQVADVYASGVPEARMIMRQQEAVLQHEFQITLPRQTRDEVYVHRVVVTPTGIYLYGPDEFAANRVLRQHRAHQDCFLRVSFTDENEDRLEFDRGSSNERILQGRFLSILQQGLDIAGEHFDFLGFSHSSLRSQSCWFMRPFMYNGHLLNARSLIQSLGDFSSIRCPAKCAARIGQAFSETKSAVRIDPDTVHQQPDIRAGQHIFTDGCGTISKLMWKMLRGNHSSKDQPTLYQIRYKGAKGMISLDTRLTGKQLRLRDSMIKFTGSPSDEVEICGTNARPLPFKLNRQVIKILEDLNIPAVAFERLQEDAIRNLQSSATSTSSAIEFICVNLPDSATKLPALLKALAQIDIDVTEDNFLRDILGTLLQIQLREIKYRSRIHVPGAVTLYGICDETGLLKAGEVYVTFYEDESQKHQHLQGAVVVTRSPALHPGDVQVVTAVSPPDSSSLWHLHNCVVFSQKGQRDLPSMLSGGDLDGDLYNIIYDGSLIPEKTEKPASYSPARPMDIGRTVTVDDMTRFFVDFMQNDQLGRIAILHQVIADDDLGTRSADCLELASLHSTAVDFSKTGVPVDPRRIPRARPYRPDYMAPSASTKVEKGIKRSTDAALGGEQPQRYRYYESDRVLGRLYRAIDEDIFFEDLEDDTSSLFSKDASDDVINEIWRWVRAAISEKHVKQYLDVAGEVRDYYESNLLDIMAQYAVARTDYLTEKEVLVGTIIGRSGAGSKFQREQSDYMKARFNRDLRDIHSWMENHWQVEDTPDGFLCLAAACLYLAAKKPSNVATGRLGASLKSFGWFAAALCVPELVKLEDDRKSATSRVNHSAEPAVTLKLGGITLS